MKYEDYGCVKSLVKEATATMVGVFVAATTTVIVGEPPLVKKASIDILIEFTFEIVRIATTSHHW